MRSILAALAMLVLAAPVFAVNPDEVLSDPGLEARARSISAGLRCLVCQNESIDDSNADLAREIRVIVRERLVAGDSDDEVFRYLVERYGEYVLLRPVLAAHTVLLWGAAPLVLIVGGILLIASARRKRVTTVEPLDAEEQRMLDELDSGKL
jgi:cytochrome c-type biogenesis protein CcmH